MFKIIKKNFFLSISTFLILYFFFNLLDGERGLLSYLKKKKSLIDLQNKELLLLSKIKNLGWQPSMSSDQAIKLSVKNELIYRGIIKS